MSLLLLGVFALGCTEHAVIVTQSEGPQYEISPLKAARVTGRLMTFNAVGVVTKVEDIAFNPFQRSMGAQVQTLAASAGITSTQIPGDAAFTEVKTANGFEQYYDGVLAVRASAVGSTLTFDLFSNGARFAQAVVTLNEAAMTVAHEFAIPGGGEEDGECNSDEYDCEDASGSCFTMRIELVGKAVLVGLAVYALVPLVNAWKNAKTALEIARGGVHFAYTSAEQAAVAAEIAAAKSALDIARAHVIGWVAAPITGGIAWAKGALVDYRNLGLEYVAARCFPFSIFTQDDANDADSKWIILAEFDPSFV